MNQSPLISVIVPVYNNEKYIAGCLKSLLAQSYPELEIIVINDGSTDKTLSVLNEQFSSYPQIKIINKENGGVSAARNDGLRAATGELIAFCDSDDEYLPGAFETMVCEMEEDVDYLVCSHQRRWIKKTDYLLTPQKLTTDEIKADFIALNLTFNFIWGNLYRKTIIDENRLAFNEAVSFAEDYEFNLQYIKHLRNKVKISDSIVYLYYISRSGEHKKEEAAAGNIEVILDFFDGREKTPDDIYRYFVARYLNQCLNRYIAWYPPREAALKMQQPFEAALTYADEAILAEAFTPRQRQFIQSGQYDALVKDRIKNTKNFWIDKVHFRLSKSLVKALNKLERTKK